MPQKITKILPKYLNTDESYENILPTDSPFLKSVETGINSNPDLGTGTNNPTEEGQNSEVLTVCRSLVEVPKEYLPEGYKKNIGSFESVRTHDLFSFYYNENGAYVIFVTNGDTGITRKVVQDIELQFTDDQDGFIAPHRVSLRPILNEKGETIEKILLITDGKSWQKWILVNAGIATDGFNVSLYPYFTALAPHFDRREVLEWATRPIMYNPLVRTVPNTVNDKGKVNRLVDSAFQFAVSENYTDNRQTVLSPYSLPLIVNSTDFLNNPDNISKNAIVTMYAGGVWVESLDIYVRQCKKQDAGIPSEITWDDWKWIDRIYKFGSAPNVLETEFWLRSNPWPGLNYNTTFNTIDYNFDNYKLGLPPLIDVNKYENDLPQLSVAHSQLADAEALSNNRYGYNNLKTDQVQKLSIEVKTKLGILCPADLVSIKVYGVVAQCDSDFTYQSQVGYVIGADTQVRFGGLRRSTSGNFRAQIDVNESKFFKLDLADKECFRVYAKGTPFFADGKWVQVNSDNSIVVYDEPLDFSSNDVLDRIQSVFHSGGYFAIQWELKVPRGNYNLAIGRHNVASSGDYRGTSTYVYGIANSRVKSATGHVDSDGAYMLVNIKPNAIQTFSKEMEIDCTNGNVDIWGNGKDMFYIYCPYNHSTSGQGRFRFIEGYFREDKETPLPVELFPYIMTKNNMDDGGRLTDKNGFYWAYTKAADSANTDILLIAKTNCSYPHNYTLPTSQVGTGWRENAPTYLSDQNGGVVGACNRIVYRGRITSLDGLIGYSNISISIVDGSTVYTRGDGTFDLIVHNGQSTLRVSNVYVNAGGSFRISIVNCGFIPLFNFNEALATCINCHERIYPIDLVLRVNAQGGSQTSLKENGTYSVGLGTADLAGRLSFVDLIKNVSVPSFLKRDNVLATYFQALISGPIQFEPDKKWATFYVSKNTSYTKYLDWVGDKIQYIDSNGNVVSDPASAVLCAIYIDSLYNANIANNFSLLASYQFAPKDRVRVLDNGDGDLLDVATYGDEIDLQVLGTNYNQAAQAAGIVPNVQNPIVNINTDTTELNTSVTLFVKYDARLDKLIKKTGFWIEIYTPIQQTEKIPYAELQWYPIVNGEIATFTGFNVAGLPQYTYPTQIDIPFWDTYLFNRTIDIPDIGSKFLGHPFNSPNVSDDWGSGLTSGGRLNTVNPNAKQQWYVDDVARSDNFITGSSINGLGLFRRENRKSFSNNPAGAIIAMIAGRNTVLFICENSFFTTNYQFHFAYVNAQGVMQVNLDNDLSQPFEKIGDDFGCSPDHTGTIIAFDKFVHWYDQKNGAWVISDYRSAKDVASIVDQEGKQYGIKSTLLKKSEFIGNWNNTHDKESRFDVISGIDMVRKNVFLTFRPRRKNTNAISSYENQRRNLDYKHQETFVYNYEQGRWLRTEGFTPEGYGCLRGSTVGVQMYSFAASKMYSHNNLGSTSFLKMYENNVEPVATMIFNDEKEMVKILQNISLDATAPWFVDLVYDQQTNSYSYIPLNYVKEKENNFYTEFLRDMVSYLAPGPDNNFRSTLLDGKRLFGDYFFVRIVGNPKEPNKYRQLADIFYAFTASPSNKK